MITIPIDQWKKELLFAGKVVDNNNQRYVELLDMVDGDEDAEVFQAIIHSIQSEKDYGVYESAHNALWKFAPEKFAQYFVPLLPCFIQRMEQYDQVARFLCPLLGWAEKDYLTSFNTALNQLSSKDKKIIMDFVHTHEKQGWFEEGVGKIHI